jgi:hypothetical protein
MISKHKSVMKSSSKINKMRSNRNRTVIKPSTDIYEAQELSPTAGTSFGKKKKNKFHLKLHSGGNSDPSLAIMHNNITSHAVLP